jgi:hypothetical protein
MESSDVLGCKVENSKGENLGKIESLMLDLSEGRILYAVLSFGGFLGMGDKLFPVPVEALSFRTDEKGKMQRAIFDVDKETLKNAPGYDRDQLPNWSDRTYATQVYSHYGYTPWWGE